MQKVFWGGVGVKTEFVEIIKAASDIFNNPVSITAAIAAVITGILMFRFVNGKKQLLYLCGLLAFSLASTALCVVANTPDCLAVPMFMLPFLGVTAIIIFTCNLTKMIYRSVRS